MYKIAVLINENEMAHSAFANTPKLLADIPYIQNHKEEYRFDVFDKFNVSELFDETGSKSLLSFDSLFVSTNATNNKEILDALRSNSGAIESFIAHGGGIFVSSQKKLSCKEGEKIHYTSFLPEKYDYAIIDRPEKSSAEGQISLVGMSDNLILTSPNAIEEDMIRDRCKHNSFMPHTYRSFIIPRNESQYVSLLADTSSQQIPDALKNSLDKSRKILLCSAKDTERVVVSTMALDWAGHKELIENILIYITEGASYFAFVKKNATGNNTINSYILRAKVGKIAYREYIEPTVENLLNASQNIFVFSPEYSSSDITTFINQAQGKERLISVYHLVDTNGDGKGLSLYHYTNETSIDRIKSETINWVMRNFYPTIWGKSVWSFNYTLSMMRSLGIDYKVFLPVLYEELSAHFVKKETIDGSYDRVINATCNMLEILSLIAEVQDALFYEGGTKSFNDIKIAQKYPIELLKCKTEVWLVNSLKKSSNSKYDKLYILCSLYRTRYIERQTIDVQKNFNEIAYQTIQAFVSEGFQGQSTIVLCQAMNIIKELLKYSATNGGITSGKANDYANEILSVLAHNQNDYGQWGNISETAEVVLTLLEIELDKKKDGCSYLDLSDITISITSSIERLFQTYDRNSCCWYNDINTTVKAIHAIGLYDRVKNYSANDFFHDISVEYDRFMDIQFINQDTRTLSRYINAIYEKEHSIKELRIQNNNLKYFRTLFFGTFISALSLLIMTILIIAGLTNEVVVNGDETISVLSKLFNDWQAEFIFGFIGIIFGALFTGAYSFVKKKTFE